MGTHTLVWFSIYFHCMENRTLVDVWIAIHSYGFPYVSKAAQAHTREHGEHGVGIEGPMCYSVGVEAPKG